MSLISVRFLGPSRDWSGARSATFEMPEGSNVKDLRIVLEERYEGLRAALRTVRIAVNEDFASDLHPLKQGDEVALIPPVSGGANADNIWVEFIEYPLPSREVRDFITADPEMGGIVVFEGSARMEQDAEFGELKHLEYEVYKRMAINQIQYLTEEARRRWSCGRSVVLHRSGVVPVGQSSVVVAVACNHRSEAFDACRWIIDSIKKQVPIWKKNVFEDGDSRWVDPTPPFLQAVRSVRQDGCSRGVAPTR